MTKVYTTPIQVTPKTNNQRRLRILLFALFFSGMQQVFSQPTITTFTPSTGAAGIPVTITGTNFNTTLANNIVFFGATRATVTAASTTSLTVTAPNGATYQPITVLNTTTHLTGISKKPFAFLTKFTPSKPTITTADLNTQQTFTVTTGPGIVVFSDLDGDGKADVLTASFTTTNVVSILRNTSTSGTTSFAPKVDLTSSSSTLVSSVAAGDLDGDGKPDIVVTNYIISTGDATTVTIFRNTSTPGSLSFVNAGDFAADLLPYAVAIGDLDGDGKPDLAVVNNYMGIATSPTSTVGLSVLRNTSVPGTISFAARVDYTTGSYASDVRIGDIDGDGKNDVIVANSSGAVGNTVSIFRNLSTSGSISLAAKSDLTVGSGPFSAILGDIDGDGKVDVISSNYNDNNISVLRNTSTSGAISFAGQQTFATGVGPSYLGIGDLDGDGKPDIAIPNYGINASPGNTVSVLRNTSSPGSVSFAGKVDFTAGSFPYGAMIGDLDGDGRADLAVTNSVYNPATGFYTGTTISILPNNSHGTLPLHLLSFTGKLIKDDGQVELSWQTVDEQDVSRFEAEWCDDGSSWTKIATVAAKNGRLTNSYSCLHTTISSSNFYRLRMVDLDGRSTYSQVLKIDAAKANLLVLYPNPAKNTIAITGLGNKPAVISLVSTIGKVVLQKNVNATATAMDISTLARGIYLVQIKQTDKTTVFKLEKE